jgi:hypothetical protein
MTNILHLYVTDLMDRSRIEDDEYAVVACKACN